MQLLNTVFLLSGGWIQAIQLFAALSILIVLHEFGHFFFARLFKTRVEKFYLFFDFMFPFPNVLPFSLFKKKKGDTEYGIGWFPLGGYVKIAGMVDESMDKEAMKLPPQPWEYRSKKPWQKLFIMLGGIIMNVIVAILVYIFMFGIWGENYLETKNMTYGIAVDSTAYNIGLRDGDKIVSLDGESVENMKKFQMGIIFKGKKDIRVERDGKAVDIHVPDGTVRNIIKRKGSFVYTRYPLAIDSVPTKSLAHKIGLREDDSILAINGQYVTYFHEFERAKKDLAEKPVSLTILRNNDTILLNTVLPKDKLFGFNSAPPSDFMQYKDIQYNFAGSVGRGLSYTWEQFQYYLLQFKMIFTSKEVDASESLGGFYSFGQMFPTVFSWHEFLGLVAFVSIILAFMNLLPIPGLDGGYVFFLLFEMVSGKQVSDKVMERATTAGLVILLALMLWANGLDVFRAFR